MTRKRLIFFVSADPATEPALVAAAYHFANVAASAQLDTEVRLAGDAVLVADPAYVATVNGGEGLQERMDQAVAGGGVVVSVCPRSVEARGIRDDQLEAIGARRRSLSDILVEVAEGRSVLVRM